MNRTEFWQLVFIATVQAGQKYPHFVADEAVDALDNRIESGLLPPIDPPADEAPGRAHPPLEYDERGAR